MSIVVIRSHFLIATRHKKLMITTNKEIYERTDIKGDI